MKRFVFFAVLVLFCSAFVFASDNSIKVSAVPYGVQNATSSDKSQSSVNSGYGTGAGFLYQRKLNGNFFAEAGVNLNIFFMSASQTYFTSIPLVAGAGYRFDFTDKVSASVHFDLAVDISMYRKSVSGTFAMVTGVGASYSVNEKMNICVGFDETISFAKNNSVTFVTYRAVPYIGLGFDL